jgi:hypothetical protein
VGKRGWGGYRPGSGRKRGRGAVVVEGFDRTAWPEAPKVVGRTKQRAELPSGAARDAPVPEKRSAAASGSKGMVEKKKQSGAKKAKPAAIKRVAKGKQQ